MIIEPEWFLLFWLSSLTPLSPKVAKINSFLISTLQPKCLPLDDILLDINITFSLVNLLFFTSITVLLFYIILSASLTPIALNKSRQLLSKDQLNSFLPTIRTQQFSDSFKGFTFIVEKKINNEIKNILIIEIRK